MGDVTRGRVVAGGEGRDGGGDGPSGGLDHPVVAGAGGLLSRTHRSRWIYESLK